jgi:hypothetical protein
MARAQGKQVLDNASIAELMAIEGDEACAAVVPYWCDSLFAEECAKLFTPARSTNWK